VASWFETAQKRLLTMRVWDLILRSIAKRCVSKDDATVKENQLKLAIAIEVAKCGASGGNELSRQHGGRLGHIDGFDAAALLPQFSFRLMPELVVPAVRPMVAFPDFVGPLPDLIFGGLFHGRPRMLNRGEHGPTRGLGVFQERDRAGHAFETWPSNQFDDLKVVPDELSWHAVTLHQLEGERAV
jgi:hypothetical protein